MNDLCKRDILDLQEDIDSVVENLDIPKKKDRLAFLQKESLESNFWDNVEKARKIMSEISYIQEEVDTVESLKNDISSLMEMFNSVERETDQNLLIDEFLQLRERVDKFSLRKFLSGKYDALNAILTIYSGQGGTESNDWVEMLYRMYTMYFDKQGWEYQITNLIKGNEAGISNVEIHVNHAFAFGYLKKESGAHRLVRISPFNSQGLRQTTFAGVEVLPVFEDDDSDIEIPDGDIEFKAVKSGGPGGQNVNKTSSAVQITHLPTGITVQSSNERSQIDNRKNAMAILKAKLWKIKEEEKLEKISDIKGEYKLAGWGNQIRNYVLHPYKLVKDLRTGVELTDVEYVLDGNIDELIDAEIRIQ